MREAIRDGRLAPGSRVPSTRALARDLSVARGTVKEAYAQLIAEGYLLARPGSGTSVVTGVPQSPVVPVSLPPPPAPRADFRPGSPDLSSFPRSGWLAASRRALRHAPDAVLGYGDPRGRPELRRALANYLARVRGVRTKPELVVVCGGFAQGLTVLCRALRSIGISKVAMEDPCIPAHRAAARTTPLTVVSVPVDTEGVRVDALAVHSPGAVFVTPAHQCMLGMTMVPGRRVELLRWAADAQAVVIEDDYDGEFRYDRQPVGALQGLDPDRVIYAGTASKTLAPGLRLAWLAAPPHLIEAVVEAKRLTDGLSGVLDQLTLADFIESGGFDRHIRRMRLRYRRRRDLLIAAVAERAPALQPSGIAAGLHVVLSLPRHGPMEEEAVAYSAEHGVALFGLGQFFADRDNHVPGLVVGYGTPPEHSFDTALRSLIGVLGELWSA